jgi:hypothetical protein
MIDAIEAYRAANGRYPTSLASLHEDFNPGVIGVEAFGYEPSGRSYNVLFKQFASDIAAREIVVYNPLDEQEFTSHDSCIPILSPQELARTRGYFAVNEANRLHWKYFWFD